MAGKTISTFRLLLNGAGCTVIAVFGVPLGLAALTGWASGNVASTADPDAARVVLAMETLGGAFGAIALVSLVRTARAWRSLHRE